MTKTSIARAAGQTQISISMSDELLERIERAGAADHRNRSNFITLVLDRWLTANGYAAYRRNGKAGQ